MTSSTSITYRLTPSTFNLVSVVATASKLRFTVASTLMLVSFRYAIILDEAHAGKQEKRVQQPSTENCVGEVSATSMVSTLFSRLGLAGSIGGGWLATNYDKCNEV